MVFKKMTTEAQTNSRPDYVKVGRCALTYLPSDGVKPIFRGHMYIEEKDADGDVSLTTYFIAAFAAKEGSKAVATGSAKLSEDRDCQVSFYLSILQGQDGGLYALVNKPKEEGSTAQDIPIKLSLFDTEHEYYFTGSVSVPVPF